MTTGSASPAAQDDGGGFAVPTQWPDMSQMPLHYVNQIAVGSDGIDLVLTFGQAFPPPLPAKSPGQLEEMLSSLGTLTIQPVARIVLPAARARELLDVLRRGLDSRGTTS